VVAEPDDAGFLALTVGYAFAWFLVVIAARVRDDSDTGLRD